MRKGERYSEIRRERERGEREREGREREGEREREEGGQTSGKCLIKLFLCHVCYCVLYY